MSSSGSGVDSNFLSLIVYAQPYSFSTDSCYLRVATHFPVALREGRKAQKCSQSNAVARSLESISPPLRLTIL